MLRQRARQGRVARTRVHEQDLPLLHEARRHVGERTLQLRAFVMALVERRDGLGQQRTAVDTTAQPLRCEIAQIAPDRILRYAELLREIGRDDLAVAMESVEDQLLSLARQRGVGRDVHGRKPSRTSSARNCAASWKWMPWMPSALAASTLTLLSSMKIARAGSMS